jgi:hypothetical protein
VLRQGDAQSLRILAVRLHRIVHVRRWCRPVDLVTANHRGEPPRRMDDVVDQVGHDPVRTRHRAPVVVLADRAEQDLQLVQAAGQDLDGGIGGHTATQPLMRFGRQQAVWHAQRAD